MIRAGTTVRKTTGPMTSGARMRKVGAKKKSGSAISIVVARPLILYTYLFVGVFQIATGCHA